MLLKLSDKVDFNSMNLAITMESYKTPAKHRDIFRDTLIAKKYGEGEDRTLDPLAGKAISEVHFSPWSGAKVEF